MKIIDKEEREAHSAHVLTEGVKGMFYGSVISLGLFAYLRVRHPVKFKRFNTSIKTCILTMPTISLAAFYADEGSVEFDRQMYCSDHKNTQMLEQYKEWKKLPFFDKVVTSVGTHKYKIIFSSWVASMYGSWVFVNRDKIMTAPQKLVQARMYAQAFTIVLLLSTIALAMKEEEIKQQQQPAPLPEWKRVLEERVVADKLSESLIGENKKTQEEV